MARVWSFLLLAFGIAWGIAGIGYVLGVRSAEHAGYIIVAALAMLGPALAALIQHRLLDKAPWPALELAQRRIRWKFVWLTVLVGLCIVPAYFLVIALFGNTAGIDAFGQVSITSERFSAAIVELLASAGQQGTPSSLIGLLTNVPAGLVLVLIQIAAVFAAFTVNLPFMLGEELGWRGYLYQRTMVWSGMRRILFTGSVWGLWHAPLIDMGHNYPGHPVAGIVAMVLFCVAAAVLFDWSRSRSGSVWSACVLHGIINGTAGGTALFAWGGHPLVGSIAGAAGALAIALLAVVVVAVDATYRKSLMRADALVVLGERQRTA